MRLINGFFLSLSMYSAIPTPNVPYSEENRRYVLCFFPLVGVIIAFLEYLLYRGSVYFKLHAVLYAALAVALPVLITGGIHLDGFLDVSDAKGSYAEREKKLSIMSDPHIGSFAAIALCIATLLQLGLWTQLFALSKETLCAVAALTFVQSRALSALCAVTMKNAKGEGLLFTFTHSAQRIAVLVSALIYFLGAAVFGLFLSPYTEVLVLLAGGLAVLRYRRSAYRQFGGITGDTEGHFLQSCELWMLFAVILGGLLCY